MELKNLSSRKFSVRSPVMSLHAQKLSSIQDCSCFSRVLSLSIRITAKIVRLPTHSNLANHSFRPSFNLDSKRHTQRPLESRKLHPYTTYVSVSISASTRLSSLRRESWVQLPDRNLACHGDSSIHTFWKKGRKHITSDIASISIPSGKKVLADRSPVRSVADRTCRSHQ